MSRIDRLRPARRPRPSRRGFTLVEVMISATLGTIILAAVLSAFLMLGRSGYNAANYSIMEAEARRALEQFSSDARMANNLVWNSSTSVTLRVVTGGSSQLVTYAYDSSSSGETAGCFYRKLGNASSTATPLILVRNITEFAFRRYKVVNGVDFAAINDLETKQLQITLRSVRTGITTVDVTNAVLSARVVLRNKAVST
jgi:prepilin-type N-terminal cleavage/methylation domain-containing protein